jgi:hypothetical protein
LCCYIKIHHQSVLHSDSFTNDLVTSFIVHLENTDSVTYAAFPNVYTLQKPNTLERTRKHEITSIHSLSHQNDIILCYVDSGKLHLLVRK